MMVGDLVEFKAPGLDSGIAIVTKVAPNPHKSLSYKIWVTWQNGVEGLMFNWQVRKIA